MPFLSIGLDEAVTQFYPFEEILKLSQPSDLSAGMALTTFL
jgi:hypothetical protein